MSFELHKTTSPNSPREPPGGITNVSKSRCHQNLSNTVYRIEIDSVKKKIDNWLDRKFFFFIFGFPVLQNVKNVFLEKKNRFFDKLIIKNVQKELFIIRWLQNLVQNELFIIRFSCVSILEYLPTPMKCPFDFWACRTMKMKKIYVIHKTKHTCSNYVEHTGLFLFAYSICSHTQKSTVVQLSHWSVRHNRWCP